MRGDYPSPLFFEVRQANQSTCQINVIRSPSLDPDGRTLYTVSFIQLCTIIFNYFMLCCHLECVHANLRKFINLSISVFVTALESHYFMS